MSLKAYKAKRNFKKTREPEGKVHKNRGKLAFVVQKHNASRLHYDFRLEMEGVLKSWAVPKGPSLNPADKRLAIMVEDHPWSYRNFEGWIPEGQYGAGTVIVWDRGTYHPVDSNKPKEDEKILLAGLKKGHIDFVLEGEKLKGAFSLFRFRTAGDNQWLLVKKDDEFASDEDVLEKDKSVISDATIEKLEKEGM